MTDKKRRENKKQEQLDQRDPRFRKISITVDAYLPWIENPETGHGRGLMTFNTFVTDVKEADGDREHLGSIGGGLGSVTLSRKSDEDPISWRIYHDDLWHAFTRARDGEGQA